MPLAVVVGISLAAAQTCGSQKLAVQILGSGGPFPSSSASSGYIVWVDGRSAVLVDAGGGVFHRFGESGARIDELEFAAISHLHPDHVSDLPPLLWFTPGVIGDVAARAKARRLILSHVTRPLAGDPNGAVYSAYDQATLTMSVAEVKTHYQGALAIAQDLQCIVVRD